MQYLRRTQQFFIVYLRLKFHWTSCILSSNLIPDPILYEARVPGPWELGCDNMISLCCAFVEAFLKKQQQKPQTKNKTRKP